MKPKTCERPSPDPLPTPLVVKNGLNARSSPQGSLPPAIADRHMHVLARRNLRMSRRIRRIEVRVCRLKGDFASVRHRIASVDREVQQRIGASDSHASWCMPWLCRSRARLVEVRSSQDFAFWRREQLSEARKFCSAPSRSFFSNSDIMEQPPPELAVFLSYQCVIVGRRRMQVTSLQVIEVAA
jgi:hypothetical protein